MDQSEIWKRIKENRISENFLLYFKNILMRKIYSSKGWLSEKNDDK